MHPYSQNKVLKLKNLVYYVYRGFGNLEIIQAKNHCNILHARLKIIIVKLVLRTLVTGTYSNFIDLYWLLSVKGEYYLSVTAM